MKLFVFPAVQSLACSVSVPVAEIFEMGVNDNEVVTAVTDDVETENVSCLSKRCSCRLREQSRSDVNCWFPQCIKESAAGRSFTSQTAMKSSREILVGARERWFCRFIRFPVSCLCVLLNFTEVVA